MAAIKMFRETPQNVGGPVLADVHPDEVAGFVAGGWSVVPVVPEVVISEPVAEKPKRKR